MADTVQRVDYFYVTVPDKPGEAARILSTLKEAGVNLTAFCGFPEGRGAQLDFVPADVVAFRRVARKARWKLTGPKRAFLAQGDDRVGAVADILGRLAEARINVVGTQALCAGGGRYAAILWVAPRDYNRAARAIGAA
jgi:hypothetical protein